MSDRIIVDRRAQRGDRNLKNLERHKNRYKKQLKNKVDDLLDGRNLQDLGKDGEIKIRPDDTDEPRFAKNPSTGESERVHPGNDRFVAGDIIDKPSGGKGGGASEDGGGEDEFSFVLSAAELLDIYFEDCALPRLVKKTLIESLEKHYVNAGIVTEGPTTRMHIKRTFQQSIMRKVGQRGAIEEAIREIEEEIEAYRIAQGYGPDDGANDQILQDLLLEIEELRQKTPLYLDDVDTRFRNYVVEPAPDYKAVMFCVMDVSGSMTEKEKHIAKKFFRILYLFLNRNYKHVELIFVRHTTEAQEVDEDTFFNDRESGGTKVSSALILTEEIIKERYSSPEWNVYTAQASDGDNWGGDSFTCGEILLNGLLALVQYWAYIEIAPKPQNLWTEYEKVCDQDPNHAFAMARVNEAEDVFPVFRELFKKREIV